MTKHIIEVRRPITITAEQQVTLEAVQADVRTPQQKDEDYINRPDGFGYWMLVIAILFVAFLYAGFKDKDRRLAKLNETSELCPFYDKNYY